jgi:hypothetical protein
VLPVHRRQALDYIRREVEAAREKGLNARLLIPMTRGVGQPSLHFEVELPNLDRLDEFRTSGVGSDEETGEWMRQFSEILLSPPAVELFRVDESAQP